MATFEELFALGKDDPIRMGIIRLLAMGLSRETPDGEPIENAATVTISSITVGAMREGVKRSARVPLALVSQAYDLPVPDDLATVSSVVIFNTHTSAYVVYSVDDETPTISANTTAPPTDEQYGDGAIVPPGFSEPIYFTEAAQPTKVTLRPSANSVEVLVTWTGTPVAP